MTHTYFRLRDLFERCVDLPDGERAQWMDRHVVDTGQRIELELMLAADRHATGFLQRDVVEHIDQLDAAGKEFHPDSLIGRRFGAFVLQRLLGSGGQGTVYLADRVDSDFAQTAAVKLLHRGIHDPAEHRRFRREREILARFEQAGVARLIDGGVSGDGVPYLIMEYVEGVTIERWCDEQALDVRARVALFAQLCEVVAAAHRALIVHRDLKPSNVLVTPEGVVKVLDFGIARLLDEGEDQTRTAAPMMTPGYGAPEQACGGTITLATDVYALGMLLRVLLTGAPPPSEPGANRALPDQVPTELRWIIGKACTLESDRRYRDAAELGDDLARFLSARPVLAHPPSRLYITRKFINRHRGGVLTTMAVLLAILTSAGVAIWQAKIAREQAQRAEAASDFLLSIFESAQEDLPKDARPTPDVLARAAAKKLESDTRLAPIMRAEFLGTLSTISYSGNDYAQAIEQAERGLAVLAANDDTRSRQALALQIKRANALVSIGKAEEADHELGERIDAIRAVADEVAVEGFAAYAGSRIVVGHIDEALALTKASAQLAEKIFGRGSKQALVRAAEHGDALAFAGHNQEASEVLENVMAQWRASKTPSDHHLANSLQNLATAKFHLGDHATGERLLRESLALSRQIYTAPHERIADVLFSLGSPLMDAGKYDDAEQVMLEAAAMYAKLFGPLHAQNAGMLDGLGSLEMGRGRYPKAAQYLERATQICTEGNLQNNPDCARFWQNLSHAYLKLNRIDDADAANTQSLELRRRLFGDQHPAVAGSLAGRAAVQLRRGKPDVALTAIDQALAIFATHGQGASLGSAIMRSTRASALRYLHRYPEALEVLDQADAVAADFAGSNAEYRSGALALRAEILSDSGRDEEAQQAARAALALEAEHARLSEVRVQRLKKLAY